MADSRINVYHNLATMLDAGMPISRALKTIQRHGRFGRVIGFLEKEVIKGQSLSDAVDIHKKKLANLDIALIKVGEHTGQLSEVFELLSQWYAFCHRIKQAVINGLIFPLAEFHGAAFMVPVVDWAFSQFDPAIYFMGVLRFLCILYVPAIIIYAICKMTPREGIFRRILDTVVMYTPLLGKAVRELELSRYSKVFATTYKAGMPIVRCSEMALDSVVNLVIKDRLKTAHEQVKIGNEMSTGFGMGLPSEFKAVWEIGEESGDLDESCWRLGNMHGENAENRFMVFSKVLVMAITLLIMGILIYYVFQGYAKIYGGLTTI